MNLDGPSASDEGSVPLDKPDLSPLSSPLGPKDPSSSLILQMPIHSATSSLRLSSTERKALVPSTVAPGGASPSVGAVLPEPPKLLGGTANDKSDDGPSTPAFRTTHQAITVKRPVSQGRSARHSRMHNKAPVATPFGREMSPGKVESDSRSSPPPPLISSSAQNKGVNTQTPQLPRIGQAARPALPAGPSTANFSDKPQSPEEARPRAPPTTTVHNSTNASSSSSVISPRPRPAGPKQGAGPTKSRPAGGVPSAVEGTQVLLHTRGKPRDLEASSSTIRRRVSSSGAVDGAGAEGAPSHPPTSGTSSALQASWDPNGHAEGGLSLPPLMTVEVMNPSQAPAPAADPNPNNVSLTSDNIASTTFDHSLTRDGVARSLLYRSNGASGVLGSSMKDSTQESSSALVSAPGGGGRGGAAPGSRTLRIAPPPNPAAPTTALQGQGIARSVTDKAEESATGEELHSFDKEVTIKTRLSNAKVVSNSSTIDPHPPKNPMNKSCSSAPNHGLAIHCPQPSPWPRISVAAHVELKNAFSRFVLRLPEKWTKPVLRSLVLQTLSEGTPLVGISCASIHDAYLDLVGEVLFTKQWHRHDIGGLTATQYPLAIVRQCSSSALVNCSFGTSSRNMGSSITKAGGTAGPEEGSHSRGGQPPLNITTVDLTAPPKINLLYLSCTAKTILRFHITNLLKSIVKACRKNMETKLQDEIASAKAQGRPRRSSSVLLSSTEVAVAMTKLLSRGITFNAHLAQGVARTVVPGSRLFLPRHGSSKMSNASEMLSSGGGRSANSMAIGLDESDLTCASVSFEAMPSIFLKFREDQKKALQQQVEPPADGKPHRVNSSALFSRLRPYFRQEFVNAFSYGHPSCCLFATTLAPEFFVGMTKFMQEPLHALNSALKATLHRLYQSLTGELAGLQLPRDLLMRIRAPPLQLSLFYVREARAFFVSTPGIAGKLFFAPRPNALWTIPLDNTKLQAEEGTSNEIVGMTMDEMTGYASASRTGTGGDPLSQFSGIQGSYSANTPSSPRKIQGAYDMPTIHSCSVDLNQLARSFQKREVQKVQSKRSGDGVEPTSGSAPPPSSSTRWPTLSLTPPSDEEDSETAVLLQEPLTASEEQLLAATQSSSSIMHTVVISCEAYWKTLDPPSTSRLLLILRVLDDVALRVPGEARHSNAAANSSGDVGDTAEKAQRRRASSVLGVLEQKVRDVKTAITKAVDFSAGRRERLEEFFLCRLYYYLITCPCRLQHIEKSFPCPHKAEYDSPMLELWNIVTKGLRPFPKPSYDDEDGLVDEATEKICYLPLSGALSYWLAAEAQFQLDGDAGNPRGELTQKHSGIITSARGPHKGEAVGSSSDSNSTSKFSVVVVNLSSHRHSQSS